MNHFFLISIKYFRNVSSTFVKHFKILHIKIFHNVLKMYKYYKKKNILKTLKLYIFWIFIFQKCFMKF